MKNLHKLNDRSVSSIVGILLMVAVTVALVALVTVVVFDIGGDVSEPADATVKTEKTGDNVQVTVLDNRNVDEIILVKPDGTKKEVDTISAGKTISQKRDQAGTYKIIGKTTSGSESLIDKVSVSNSEVVNTGVDGMDVEMSVNRTSVEHGGDISLGISITNTGDTATIPNLTLIINGSTVPIQNAPSINSGQTVSYPSQTITLDDGPKSGYTYNYKAITDDDSERISVDVESALEKYDGDPMIITVNTTRSGSTSDTEFKFNIRDSHKGYNLNWSEGKQKNLTSSHTISWSNPGTYQVRVSGYLTGIKYNGIEEADKIESIDQWGDISWDTFNRAFAGADNLTANYSDKPNLTQTTSMEAMFSETSFNGKVSDWNTSNVNSMRRLFDDTPFNRSIDTWNTSNVTDMSAMFVNARSFNKSLNSLNVSGVTDMSAMFARSGFNRSLDNWDTGNVTSMAVMFDDSEFNKPINTWDTSSVTDMSSMFSDNTVFNQSLNSWNTSSVTSMRRMFWEAKSFNKPLDNWDTGNVVNTESMFYFSNFNNSINSWDVSNVEDMHQMFHRTSFNQPLNNWDTSNVTSMEEMFENTPFNQPIGSWDVSNVTDMSYMMSNQFNQSINNWDVSNVKNMKQMFGGQFNQPVDKWNTSSVTNMDGLFSSSEFNRDISSWDTSSVTSMNQTFAETDFNKSISSWDVSNVEYMDLTFIFNDNFDQNLGSWNPESLENAKLSIDKNAGPEPKFELSASNYDSLLCGWESHSVDDNVALQAGTSQYTSSGETCRDKLINDHSWTIEDGGKK